MKVFVCFSSKNKSEAFEGIRFRKTLKGECEENDISWTSSQWSTLDLAHFICINDFSKLNDSKLDGIKTVVSPFYCENNPLTSYLRFGKNKGVTIPKRKIKFLNSADLVLVPNLELKKIAFSCGVKSRIEILPNAINLSRFKKNKGEEDVFVRYFRIRPYEKIITCTGSYKDKRKVKSLYEIASYCPGYKFIFFGIKKSKLSSSYRKVKGVLKPKNVMLEHLVEDDIYRSCFLRSSFYLILGEAPDFIGTLDSFASSTQILALNEQKFNDLLKDKETCFLFKNEKEIIDYLDSVYHENLNNTIIAGSEMAKKHSLAKVGAILKGYYLSLLEREREND